MTSFTKKHFITSLCAAALLGAFAYSAQAKYTHPIWEVRRTLNMAFGQSRIALEAPMGMCFLDESQYMEASIIKQLRTMGQEAGDGVLMAMFAECDEIEKFSQLPQMVADTPPGVDPPTANMENRGTVTWLAPKLGRAPLNLAEYLDMREPTFKEEIQKNLNRGYKKFGGMQNIKMTDDVFANVMMAAPDQYQFDDRARRTEAGISIGYSTNFVKEYKKHTQFGAVGTTMIRNFPVQVALADDGKLGKSPEELQAVLDKLLAQMAKLNP